MSIIFEIEDITGRKIRLTDERWRHIVGDHAEMSNSCGEIEASLSNPTVLKCSERDRSVMYYYKMLKHLKKYIMTSVKYLNNHGFIITSYYKKRI